MRLGRILGAVVPALALVAGLAACGGVDVRMGDGVPLADLDTSGDAPDSVALGGPDNVVITSGEEFTVTVEGSDAAKDRMRFSLDGGTLAISREDSDWSDSDVATVNITMPPPNSLVIGGSGTITADGMSSHAEIVVGGSGVAQVNGIAADSLEITIGGSGQALVSGESDRLELVIGGSGSAEMPDLAVNTAEVNIGGSGNARFASDGSVEANIAGSGTVRVSGSARCTINTVGSGRLICEAAPEAPEAPAAPAAPEAPAAPGNDG